VAFELKTWSNLPDPLSEQKTASGNLRIRLRTFQCGEECKNAAVVSIHGGPTAQTINSFSRNIQYLVNQGFFVIAPNYRGLYRIRKGV